MSEPISQIILLCEDETHERLAKSYVKRCGFTNVERTVRSLVASRMQHGGNVGWVLNEFGRQLQAFRRRQKKAHTRLIVMVDADDFTVEERRRQLQDRLRHAGYEGFRDDEAMVLLIPKRHVETWICSLLGMTVTEQDRCKTRNRLQKEDLRRAANTLYDWCRDKATPGATCVPSLAASLHEWRKIG